VEAWRHLTTNQWVRDVVSKGYLPNFVSSPPLTRTPPNWQAPIHPHVDEEVLALLEKGAVGRVPDPTSPGFYSPVFVVPKKTGDFRLIFNLKKLNCFLRTERFKMDTLRHVREALRQDEWTVSLDLKDAYLHIPMHPAFRKYLRFMHRGQAYQWLALPFGLSTAPAVFTAMMRPILAWCHRRGIPIHAYIDDWLLHHHNSHEVVHNMRKVMELLYNLGLGLNLPKSRLVPAQQFQFLGAWLNLRTFLVTPSEARILALGELFQELLILPNLTARHLARLIGMMDSLADLVPLGRWRVRLLHWFRTINWARESYEDVVPPLPFWDEGLQWWMSPDNLLQGVPVHEPLPDHLIYTDASATGWGAQWDLRSAAGTWSPLQATCHINVLELEAVLLALQTFQAELRSSTVQIHSDNSTAVAYLAKGGGTHSKVLHHVASRIFNHCLDQKIHLLALHVPGKLNVSADALSRQRRLPETEWTLHQKVCDQIFHLWGTPMVDLFATRYNRRLPAFISPMQDDLAWGRDALTCDWNGLNGYAFPPFAILLTVLRKVQRSVGSCVVIAPDWPAQPWFPLLLSLSVAKPLRLPEFPTLLTQRYNIPHPFLEKLQLHAWMLSSDMQKQKDFHKSLPHDSLLPYERPPRTSTNQSGANGAIGVVAGRLIHAIPLTCSFAFSSMTSTTTASPCLPSRATDRP